MNSSVNDNNRNIIIIDFGLYYTKLGLNNSQLPSRLIKTPNNLFLRENIYKKKLKNNSIYKFNYDDFDEKIFENKLEEYFKKIFLENFIYQTKNETIIIGFNLCFPKFYINKIIKIFFLKFKFSNIIPLNNQILGLYVTSNFSGIVFDFGYSQFTIWPIYNGFPWKNALKFSIKGSLFLMKKIYIILKDKYPDIKYVLEEDLNEILHLILVNYINIPSIYQTENYLKDEIDIEKMKNKNLELKYKNRIIKISYYLSFIVGQYLFKNNENNIANLLFESIQEIPENLRNFLANNIILSGSNFLLNNFTSRLREELNIIIDKRLINSGEVLKKFICFNKIDYPCYNYNWVGGLYFSKLNFNQNNDFILNEYNEIKIKKELQKQFFL